MIIYLYFHIFTIFLVFFGIFFFVFLFFIISPPPTLSLFSSHSSLSPHSPLSSALPFPPSFSRDFPDFLSSHVGGEGSIWWKLLPLSLSLPPSVNTELSEISYVFSSYVAEVCVRVCVYVCVLFDWIFKILFLSLSRLSSQSLPEKSILLIVNSPHDALIYLSQHVWCVCVCVYVCVCVCVCVR